MSNRLANSLSIVPNDEFYLMGRLNKQQREAIASLPPSLAPHPTPSSPPAASPLLLEYNDISVSLANNVQTIALNNPSTCNALSTSMLKQLLQVQRVQLVYVCVSVCMCWYQ